jgi:hypothetical protein
MVAAWYEHNSTITYESQPIAENYRTLNQITKFTVQSRLTHFTLIEAHRQVDKAQDKITANLI